MLKEYDINVINDFIANKSSHAEAEKIAAYLENNERLLENLIPFDEKAAELVPFEEKSRVLRQIIGSKSSRIFTIGRILAAAAIIGIMATSVLWLISTKKPDVFVEEAVPSKFVSVRNNSKEQMSITLPDSSVAILEQWAELVYDSAFAHQRNIFLTGGTAYFDVRKDDARAFSVFAKGIKTTVLGTKFRVESPVAQPTITVRLNEGKVKLESIERAFEMDEVLLSPGQVCHINKINKTVSVSGYERKASVASQKTLSADKEANISAPRKVLWTNDGVQFKGAKLKNVLLQLEARYNVKVIVDDVLTDNIVLTGQIYFADSLRPILKSICDMNKMEYEIRNDSVYLRKK